MAFESATAASVKGTSGMALDGEAGVEVAGGKLRLVGSTEASDWKALCSLASSSIDRILLRSSTGGNKSSTSDLNVPSQLHTVIR